MDEWTPSCTAGRRRPIATKAETDASYKRLLERLVEAAASGVVGSAWRRTTSSTSPSPSSLPSRRVRRSTSRCWRGWPTTQAAAVAERSGRLLLYVPATTAAEDFRNALAYLARRLDENATPEGFLRHALDIVPGSAAWDEQAGALRPRRRGPPRHVDGAVPDARTGRGRAAEPAGRPGRSVRERAGHRPHRPRQPLAGPLAALGRAAAGRLRRPPRRTSTRPWPAPPRRGPRGRRRRPTRARSPRAAAEVMAAGRADGDRGDGVGGRQDLRRGRPRGVRGRRLRPLVRASDSTSSSSLEPEVDERAPAGSWSSPRRGTSPTPSPPAGRSPPSRPATRSSSSRAPRRRPRRALLVEQLHAAGARRTALQLVAAPDGPAGQLLVTHPGVGAVVLTGSWRDGSPVRRGGRRAVGCWPRRAARTRWSSTATADVDQAVGDLVRSAFGHAGQKCSAASLAIVDASIYDRSPFLRQLADATRSLRVGPVNGPGDARSGPSSGPSPPRSSVRSPGSTRESPGWSNPARSTPSGDCGRRGCGSGCGPGRGRT